MPHSNQHENKLELHRISKGGHRISRVYKKTLEIWADKGILTTYEKTQISFTNKNRTKYSRGTREKRQHGSIRRARTMLLRLVESNVNQWGNYPPVFYTITFAENVTDLQIANPQFTLFIKRLSRLTQTHIKYVCVPEFQKRGAVHFHVVFFNLPFIPKQKIQSVWGYGFTRIEKIDKINNVALYIVKYLSKSLQDKRLYGRRAYFSSRGLFRPQKFYNTYEVDKTLENYYIIHREEIILEDKKITKIICNKK